MEYEETKRQEGLNVSRQAPTSLLPKVLARLERRRASMSECSIDALRLQLAHTQWEIRAAAVQTLGEYETQNSQGADTVRALLLQGLQDEHRLVRVAAVRALGKSSKEVPMDTLLLSLRDPAWEVREMAVLVLAKLNSQHLNPLRSLLQLAQRDTHSSVREAATYALYAYYDEDTHKNMDGAHNNVHNRPNSLYARYLGIFARQIPLIHKSIWSVAPLFLLLWFVQNVYLLNGVGRNIHEAGLYLALFSTISAGAGSAFIYGAEHDAAFELTLSTPTSLRILMICRFVLVVGYNLLLVGGASAAVALFYGGGLWDIMQLWLGPVLLISSLTLMLSMLIGSLLALSVAFIIEASQAFTFDLFGHAPMLTFSFSNNWQTSPMFLLLAMVSLAFALFCAPRQPRFATV